MYKNSLTTLALMSLVSAQTTTELFLVGFDQQPLVASIIGSNSAATTYSVACKSPGSEDCGVPPSFTFTQGPSTVHFSYGISEDGSNETIELGCQITSSDHGTCSGTIIGSSGTSRVSSVETTAFSNSGIEFGGRQIVTITAGAGGSSTNTAASTPASTTPPSSASTGPAQTGSPTSRVSSATSSSSPGSAASVTTGSSSSSVNGASGAMFTGNALVVGAAALALAAM